MQSGSLSADSAGNQRRHDRFELATKIKYKVINRQVVEELVDRKTFLDDGKSVNISMSGVALHTEVPLRKGDFLKVEMTLPGMHRATRALAEVMWAEPREGRNAAGIRFLIILNEADDNSVKNFLNSMAQAEKGSA